MNCEI